MDKNLMNDMDKNLMDNLYVRYNDKFGVLSDDEREIISHILGTDLTLVLNKENMEVYLLVPLTRNHKFECKGNYIIVNGKRFDSDIYFRKDGCQWIEIDEETLSTILR